MSLQKHATSRNSSCPLLPICDHLSHVNRAAASTGTKECTRACAIGFCAGEISFVTGQARTAIWQALCTTAPDLPATAARVLAHYRPHAPAAIQYNPSSHAMLYQKSRVALALLAQPASHTTHRNRICQRFHSHMARSRHRRMPPTLRPQARRTPWPQACQCAHTNRSRLHAVRTASHVPSGSQRLCSSGRMPAARVHARPATSTHSALAGSRTCALSRPCARTARAIAPRWALALSDAITVRVLLAPRPRVPERLLDVRVLRPPAHDAHDLCGICPDLHARAQRCRQCTSSGRTALRTWRRALALTACRPAGTSPLCAPALLTAPCSALCPATTLRRKDRSNAHDFSLKADTSRSSASTRQQRQHTPLRSRQAAPLPAPPP
jgi:hypothetical protein